MRNTKAAALQSDAPTSILLDRTNSTPLQTHERQVQVCHAALQSRQGTRWAWKDPTGKVGSNCTSFSQQVAARCTPNSVKS